MAKKIRKLFHRLGENRTLLLGVVFLAMFAVLIGRLFYPAGGAWRRVCG